MKTFNVSMFLLVSLMATAGVCMAGAADEEYDEEQAARASLAAFLNEIEAGEDAADDNAQGSMDDVDDEGEEEDYDEDYEDEVIVKLVDAMREQVQQVQERRDRNKFFSITKSSSRRRRRRRSSGAFRMNAGSRSKH